MYAVIMAGGRGKRFWPRSRKSMPKQLINIIGEKTMIQETVSNLEELIPYENIFIVTNYEYTSVIKEQLPYIPTKNIIIEPIGKNTAPCIGLASILIEHIDPNAIICVLPSDHLISNKQEFQRILKSGAEIVNNKNCLLTIGLNPTKPEIGYGYIKIKPIANKQEAKDEPYEVEQFVEKPNLEKAKCFLQTKQYFWNSGMFIWNVKKILSEIEIYIPEIYIGLMNIKKSIGTKDEAKVIKQVYSNFPDISIDYGIMEKAKNIFVLPADFGWNDLGSWSTLYDISEKNNESNVVMGEHVEIDSKGLLIYSKKKLVTTIGVEDLIIVETDDSLLICKRDRDQDIKKLTDLLEKKGLEKYL